MHGAALARDDRGDGETLVLLHGVATSRLVWDRVIEPLARGRRVIAVDVPGFGESAPTGPGFELDEVADAIVRGLGESAPAVGVKVQDVADATVRGLGLERFDLVGHSLGGAVALATAARHPEAVRTLVLVAPAGLAPRATRVAAALGAAAERAEYARRVLGHGLVARSRARRVMFGASVADAGRLHPADARLLLDASRGARRVAAGVRRALEADLRDDLAAAPMPLGVIWGTADRIVPFAGLEAVRRLRPDAVVETLAATGHIPQIEHPAAFVAALERVLAALRPALQPHAGERA